MSGSSEAGGGAGGAVLVDSNKGCIPSPVVSQPLQLASGYSAVKCITGEGGAPGSSAPHLSVFNIKGCNAYPKHDLTNDCKKSLDENSNAIQSVNAGLSSSQHSKKIKRKQKCKNEKESLSNEIDGYRGDNPNIQDILKFIEDTQDTKQTSKTKPSPFNGKISKTKDDDSVDKGAKKRSTERRNKDCNKMDKLKKSNSMEELFRSKLDDLTTTPKDLLSLRKTKKQSTFDQADISDSKRSDRRSWGNDGSDAYFPQNSVSHDADDSFSTNLSNSSSAQSSVAGQTVRPKKARPPKETEVPAVVVEPTMAESSDFQTVTNKKKIRRRHSPIEDNRGRSSNSYNHTQYGGSKNTSRFTSSFPSHDRDTFYKKMGRAGSAERRHPSVSSPPSDKSNDSNDDLDSVHSLPAEASGERLQASYADMARAAAGANLPPRPATNTDNNKTANPAPNKAIWNEPSRPPAVPVTAARPAPFASPPPVVTPKEVPPPITPQLTHMQTQASALPRPNFPDLIESCNYYTNRYVDVSTENTKNLSHKDAPAVDANKTKLVKNNIVDTGTQMDQSPIYNHEQYPALEARSQKPIDIKLNPKTKVDPKVMVTPNSISGKGVGGKVTEQKQPLKALSTKEETLLEEHHVQVTPPEHYVAYVNHTSTNNMTPLPTDMCPREVSAAKSTFSVQDRKVDSFLGKPPDVVLPLTTVDISSDNRPAVIIMNEEIRKSSDNIHNIDGITFGFDINQQLINGEVVNTAVADSDNKNAPSEVAEDKRYPRVQMDNTIQIASAENAVNNNANIQRNPQINIQPRNAPTKAQTSNPPPSIPPPAAAPAVADPAVITYNTVEFPSINETHHARQEHHHHAPSAKHQEEAGGAPLQVQVPSARPIRYLPPTNNHKDSYNLDRIVDYVGTAWEDIIKSPSGKVQYFSGV